jgi:hypothetical protein
MAPKFQYPDRCGNAVSSPEFPLKIVTFVGGSSLACFRGAGISTNRSLEKKAENNPRHKNYDQKNMYACLPELRDNERETACAWQMGIFGDFL